MARCEENTAVGAFVRGAFPEFSERVAAGLCPFCGKPVNQADFKDELSRKEFGITGICQACQDDFFVERDE